MNMAIRDATDRFARQSRQIIIFDLVGLRIEEIDEEASLPLTEMTAFAAETTVAERVMVERVTVSEHFLAVEYVPVHAPERRARPRGKAIETA